MVSWQSWQQFRQWQMAIPVPTIIIFGWFLAKLAKSVLLTAAAKIAK